MNLLRATGTIGGLTLVSRVFGFARDMLLARVLGAGMAARMATARAPADLVGELLDLALAHVLTVWKRR